MSGFSESSSASDSIVERDGGRPSGPNGTWERCGKALEEGSTDRAARINERASYRRAWRLERWSWVGYEPRSWGALPSGARSWPGRDRRVCCGVRAGALVVVGGGQA